MRPELYPSPKPVVEGALELLRHLFRIVAGLASLPSGAQGGFLQPPRGSHFAD